jgi:outer membrane protein assembly factor BamA
MMTAASRWLFLFSLLLLSLAAKCVPATPQVAHATAPPGQARQLIAITVTGAKRFPQEAVAAATGLQLNTTVGEDDFKKAARRLGDTGAFSDIAYTYSFSSAGTKLEFHVTEAEKFLPAHFEDFVWFSDAQLLERIKEHVPLFGGELPANGRLADEVSDVLQALLVENGIPGHVNYLRTAHGNGPIDAIDYSVTDVLIRIRNFEFTGAAEAELPALQSATQRLSDREYSRTRLKLLVERQLLPVYLSRGYLKASFGEPQPSVISKPGAESDEGPRNQTVVDVTFAATPGSQYKVKSLEWSGNHQFPTATLKKMIPVESGQVANTVRLAEALKEVQKLYGTHGFVAAMTKVNAEFDDAADTVALRIEVKEDYEYHMGDLEFRGLDNSLMAKLRSVWKLRQGEVYDASYLSQYLPVAQKLLPTGFDWEVSTHATANVRDKTVDVDLIYTVKAPK